MVSELVIFDGDYVVFFPMKEAIIIPRQADVRIQGSGKATLGGKKVCVMGDEKNVSVICDYLTPSNPTPGSGILTIFQLGPDQLSKKTKVGGKAMICKGTKFTSKFQAQIRATNPGPNTVDPGLYFGEGMLVTTNQKVKAEE